AALSRIHAASWLEHEVVRKSPGRDHGLAVHLIGAHIAVRYELLRRVPELNRFRKGVDAMPLRLRGIAVQDSEWIYPGCAPRDSARSRVEKRAITSGND